MVFECDPERGPLVEELRRLDARPDLIAWVADPASDLSLLTTVAAVPYWDEVLRRADLEPILRSDDGVVVHEPVFSIALQAYLTCWRADVEQRELFQAAQILARAAQVHLSTRSQFAD
jgi:hypothetical protein